MYEEEKSALNLGLIAVGVLVLIPILYLITGQFMGRVNNQELTLDTPAGESHLVDAFARMIERDVKSGFCPSAYLWPGHIRYDICGFQEGEQLIWQRVALQMFDRLSREGPASESDQDLNAVLKNISRPNSWSLIFSSNNTASLLKAAVVRLDQYNERLKVGKAGYYPRIDNLSALVSDFTSLLGGEARNLTEKANSVGLYSLDGRYAYFHALGTLAASCQILLAAQADFGEVVKMQSADRIFDQAMNKSCEKIGKNPSIVINANDLSHLLTLSGSASAAVNDLLSLQTAIAAASHAPR